MKTFKTILTISGLLIIGFTAGFFTNRELMKRHIQKVGAIGGGPRMETHIFTAIGASDDQKEELGPIIQSYGKELGNLWRESRNNRRSIMDEMFAEIKPKLEADQQTKLVEFRKRYSRSKSKRGERDRGKKGEFKQRRKDADRNKEEQTEAEGQ